MKPDIHTIIEMMQSDPEGISTKFGIPIRTVYSWCSGEREPADYVICMMLNILLLERRLSDGYTEEGLEEGMGSGSEGITEAGKTCESASGKT